MASPKEEALIKVTVPRGPMVVDWRNCAERMLSLNLFTLCSNISRFEFVRKGKDFMSFPSVISNQSTWVLNELMCWLSLVVLSPPARRSLPWIQSTVDWYMAPRKWGFDLKSNSTNYPDHGHHGDPAPTRKITMVEPGIEPRTSWFVARSSDH